jgi:hypothetical protein
MPMWSREFLESRWWGQESMEPWGPNKPARTLAMLGVGEDTIWPLVKLFGEAM